LSKSDLQEATINIKSKIKTFFIVLKLKLSHKINSIHVGKI